MQQQVKVIKTQRDYDAAVVRLSALMDEDMAPGSSKEAELELLALVIESYERSKVGPVVPDPIEAILFRMDQLGLKKVDLVPYMGSLPKVSEVLARKRSLNLAMIRKLYQGLGIPADVLLAETDEAIDLSEEFLYDTNKFPLKEMHIRGYFEGCGSLREVKDDPEKWVRSFMRGFSLHSTHQARLRAPMHQNGDRLMDEYALLTWRVAVLKKARQIKFKVPYVKGSLTDERLTELARLSRFEQGPRLAQEFLADMGIALVFEDHFNKTYLDGAAMLDGDRPVVALTLRHDRLDNFWFALLHELVHVKQEHLSPERSFMVDNLEDKVHRQTAEELEADEGARDILIPEAEWLASDLVNAPTMDAALALASKLRIHPTIVAGRVRYESGNWRLLSSIKAEVRCQFPDQLQEHAQPS